MHPYVAEFAGTALLILLGNGVVANVVLKQTKGHAGGWIVITAGWGLAVFTAVACVAQYSGAHLNPAVTFGLAIAGSFDWGETAPFMIAQLLGAICGATLVFGFYHPHYAATDDAGAKLATFATGPAIRHPLNNLFCEVVGTFVLVWAVLLATKPGFQFSFSGQSLQVPVGLGSLDALPVGLIVFAIGLSLGGTTGYAINPARDLGPRIAHALLPVPGKGSNDWSYAPIPVIGPMLGATLAAVTAVALK